MSLFQCEVCGCVENTALSYQGCALMADSFNWDYAPDREGKLVCSACGPVKFAKGQPTKLGKWHDQFDRHYLPKGQFETNNRGDLVLKGTGESYESFI